MEGQWSKDVFLQPRLLSKVRDQADPEFRDEALFLAWMLRRHEPRSVFAILGDIDVLPNQAEEGTSCIRIAITTVRSGKVALVIEERGEGVFHVDLD